MWTVTRITMTAIRQSNFYEIFPEHSYFGKERFTEAGKIFNMYETLQQSFHRSQICCPPDLLHLRRPNAKFRQCKDSLTF